MRIAVLVEPISVERYRATGSEPFVGSAEAETPDAALAKLKEQIEVRLSQGARIRGARFPGQLQSMAGRSRSAPR